MKTGLPFRNLEPAGTVELRLDGRPVRLTAGANLAAALLEAGLLHLRASPVSNAPRGPFCMMGVCFDCLVEVNGTRRQACLLSVEEGMEIVRPGMAGTDDAL